MSAPMASSGGACRVAVVGAGPSGFYAAEALLSSGQVAQVDLFERLPVPYGLVRYGVAPDHPKLKQVTAVFDRIAHMPGLRYIGGVEVGVDVTLNALQASYHAVILATGAPTGRLMGIPGEALPGSHLASDFVAWYNEHPDHRDCQFDLSGDSALVVGHGNVALDVARVLLKTADELRQTDISAHALEALSQSRIKAVHIVGRRGPAQTRFSFKELHEFGTLSDAVPLLDQTDLGPGSFEPPAGAHAEAQAAVATLAQFARHADSGRRQARFRFHLAPMAIEGAGHVQRMRFKRTDGWSGDEAEALVDIPCGLILSSIGRQSVPMAGVPYDGQRGTHLNQSGRIAQAGEPVAGLYVCGWGKRGPQGTIGTNRACSQETVAAVLADLPCLTSRSLNAASSPLASLLQTPGRCFSFSDWQRINQVEVARGVAVGKPREKLVSIEHMRAAAHGGMTPC